MKKKALFLGHTFHLKTKSSDFFQEILAEEYDIISIDSDNKDYVKKLEKLRNIDFDLLVCWQVMTDLKKLNSCITYKNAVFLPMHDDCKSFKNPIWYKYRNFNIICFSKKLYEDLKKRGFCAHYFQYFPRPIETQNLGDVKSIFFWQRVTRINIKTLLKIFKNIKIDNIHIHKSIDPRQKFITPPKNIKAKITYSTWYEKKADLLSDMEKSAYYFAPRKKEGIGMSFLEAMAMGRCVVAPDYPTMNDYIQNGKTGFLYSFSSKHAIGQHDVREIQKNTIEFMKKGYEKWEHNKSKILDIVKTAPDVDLELIEKNFEDVEITKYYFLNFLPFFKTEKRQNNTTYILFGKIPLLKRVDRNSKAKYFLFGFLPLIKKVDNCSK